MELLAEADATVDEDARRQAYSTAIRLITEKAYWLPMHTIVMGYAYSSDLDIPANVDELPRFFLASWK